MNYSTVPLTLSHSLFCADVTNTLENTSLEIIFHSLLNVHVYIPDNTQQDKDASGLINPPITGIPSLKAKFCRWKSGVLKQTSGLTSPDTEIRLGLQITVPIHHASQVGEKKQQLQSRLDGEEVLVSVPSVSH